MKYFAIFAFLGVLVSCSPKVEAAGDEVRNIQYRSRLPPNMYVFKDPETGCEYFIQGDNVTPRYEAQFGHQTTAVKGCEM